MKAKDIGLTSEDLEDAIYDYVAKSYLGKSRWATSYQIVFKHNDKLYAMHYSEPATEYQDDGGVGTDPSYVDVYEVEAVQVTITEYKKVNV